MADQLKQMTYWMAKSENAKMKIHYWHTDRKYYYSIADKHPDHKFYADIPSVRKTWDAKNKSDLSEPKHRKSPNIALADKVRESPDSVSDKAQSSAQQQTLF